MRTLTLSTVLLTLSLSPIATAGPKGPSGTFRNSSGQITLKYLGEGTVAVTLKTKYCTLEVEDGSTFVFPQGIHVLNKKKEPVLVLFYQPGSVVAYAEAPAFRQAHCKGGQDVTGVFKRSGK